MLGLTMSQAAVIDHQPAAKSDRSFFWRRLHSLSGVAPQDTYWDMKVTAADSFTGVTTEIHQGVQMRLPAGNCK